MSSPFNEELYKKTLEGLEASEVRYKDATNILDFRIDSEFYKKIYLYFLQIINKKQVTSLERLAHFIIGPFGSSFDTENYIELGEYRYVRGQDVKPFILKDDDVRYLPKADYERLIKFALKERDILVSVVGTLGNSCLVFKDDLPAIFSCKSTVIRTEKINPIYLLTYLNSKYGHNLLIRKQRGAIQKGLNLDDLKTIEVPLLSDKIQDIIEEVFIEGQVALKASKVKYKSALDSLLCNLKLNEWIISETPIAIKSFNSSYNLTYRLDAEYYQPKYDELLNHICSFDMEILDNLVYVFKSIEPGSDAYQLDGVPFFRVAELSKYRLSQPEIFLDRNNFDVKGLSPKKNTILLSKDGSVGIAYKVEEDIDGITSGAILHLTIKDNRVLPDYLCLVLNSIIVQLQAERDSGGSIIQHWKPDEIKQVVIPILPKQVQEELCGMIQESFSLQRDSKQLLDAAKYAVELAIEQDENVAESWLKENNFIQ